MRRRGIKVENFIFLVDQLVNLLALQMLHFFNIFDIVSLTWSKGSTINAPTPRIDYTATLLSNGIIVFIGGRGPISNSDANSMSQLSLYDTKANSWSLMITKAAKDIIETANKRPNIVPCKSASTGTDDFAGPEGVPVFVPPADVVGSNGAAGDDTFAEVGAGVAFAGSAGVFAGSAGVFAGSAAGVFAAGSAAGVFASGSAAGVFAAGSAGVGAP